MKTILVSLLLALCGVSFATGTALSAVPAPPQMSFSTAGLDLSITWASVPDATGYTLYYAPYPFTSPETIGSIDMGTATSINMTLWEGAAYYIAVGAYNGAGASGYSNIEQFTINTHVPPTAPQMIHTVDGPNLSITWTSVPGATGYTLHYAPAPNAGPESFSSMDMGAATSFDITLWDGAAYSIAVAAYNVYGTSSYSNIESFTILSAGTPVTAEGLLKGDAAALAQSVITDYNAITDIPEDQIGVDTAGREVALSELELEFAQQATVGQVNALLSALGGRITFLLKGNPIVLVRIPNPGNVGNLDAIVAQLKSNPVVKYVRRGYFPALRAVPNNHADLGNLDKIGHHLAVRAHGAWNVRQLLNSVSPPRLVIADYFGGGPPANNYYLAARTADFVNTTPYSPHGYHVLGVIAAGYDGDGSARGLAAGIYPGLLGLAAVDLAPHIGGPGGNLRFTFPALENLLIDRVRTAPDNPVVNTSIGFKCDSPQSALANCNRTFAAQEAIQWIKKVRLSGFENTFVHIVPAGNIVVPGDTDAATDSQFAAARLIENLQLPDGTPVAPLSNTLVIENLIATGSPPQPECLHETSKYHGDLSAVGTDVWSLLGPTVGAGPMTGTSIAAPQVTGLAAYVWALQPTMPSSSVVNLLQDTSRQVIFAGGVDPRCNPMSPARVIDAYAAALATDIGNGDANVRRALLDVADSMGAPGSNGRFDEKDLQLLAAMFNLQDGAIDYSRHDLNGDARTGGDTTERFDLNLDGAFTTVSQAIRDYGVEFSEAAVTDEDVLCYYAYSDLYRGHSDVRDDILKQCQVFTFSLDPNATYLHVCMDNAEDATPFSLADLGIHAGDRIRIDVLGYYNMGGGYIHQHNTIGLFSSTNVLLGLRERKLNRVPGAIKAGANYDTGRTWFCDGEQTDIPEDFNIEPAVEVTVPEGANYLFIVAGDCLYQDNINDGDYGIRISKIREN